MTIFELATELGKTIREDERMIRMEKAKEAYESNEKIGNLIMEYGIQQQALTTMGDSTEIDTEALTRIQDRIDEIYEEITKDPLFIELDEAQKEVNATIKAEGERAVFETNVQGLHPDLIKLIGRQKYRTSYGQNVLNHSMEVAHIAGLLASELGVDVATAKRAGLLHDLGKSVDHEVEGSHVSIGVDLAKKYKESEEIIHAIHAHHGDVEPKTVIACIVQAADAISAARPGARRENLENYIKRLEKLEEIATSFKGVESSYAIQAGREVRIIVKPDEVNDDELILLSRELAKKIENDLEYPGQIKVHLIRETRAIDYAK